MCECFLIIIFYLKVDQLQVNYSREKVYIYLHPGAIVNGQYVRIPLIKKPGQYTGILVYRYHKFPIISYIEPCM